MSPVVFSFAVETASAPSPQNAARVNFYTAERRLEFGEFLYKTALRIAADRERKNNRKKGEQNQ